MLLAPLIASLILTSASNNAGFHNWVSTPPNGWICESASIGDDAFKENVDIVAATLRPHGFEYCIVDGASDPKRLKDLAGYTHKRALKFGFKLNAADNSTDSAINSMVARCAESGVDLICVSGDGTGNYDATAISTFRQAIDKSGREMALMLSSCEAPLDAAPQLMSNVNIWSVVGDKAELDYLTDVACDWITRKQLARNWIYCGAINAASNANDFANSKAETTALLTLMSFTRAPIMLHGDLRKIPIPLDFLECMNNPSLRDVRRKSILTRCEKRNRNECIITAEFADEAPIIAAFNRTDSVRKIFWLGWSAEVPPHGCAVIGR